MLEIFLNSLIVLSSILFALPYFFLEFKDTRFEHKADERQRYYRLQSRTIAYYLFVALTGVFVIFSMSGIALPYQMVLTAYFYVPLTIEQVSNVLYGVYFTNNARGKNYDNWFLLYGLGAVGLLLSTIGLFFMGHHSVFSRLSFTLGGAISGLLLSSVYFYNNKHFSSFEEEEE